MHQHSRSVLTSVHLDVHPNPDADSTVPWPAWLDVPHAPAQQLSMRTYDLGYVPKGLLPT